MGLGLPKHMAHFQQRPLVEYSSLKTYTFLHTYFENKQIIKHVLAYNAYG